MFSRWRDTSYCDTACRLANFRLHSPWLSHWMNRLGFSNCLFTYEMMTNCMRQDEMNQMQINYSNHMLQRFLFWRLVIPVEIAEVTNKLTHEWLWTAQCCVTHVILSCSNSQQKLVHSCSILQIFYLFKFRRFGTIKITCKRMAQFQPVLAFRRSRNHLDSSHWIRRLSSIVWRPAVASNGNSMCYSKVLNSVEFPFRLLWWWWWWIANGNGWNEKEEKMNLSETSC